MRLAECYFFLVVIDEVKSKKNVEYEEKRSILHREITQAYRLILVKRKETNEEEGEGEKKRLICFALSRNQQQSEKKNIRHKNLQDFIAIVEEKWGRWRKLLLLLFSEWIDDDILIIVVTGVPMRSIIEPRIMLAKLPWIVKLVVT